VRLDRGAEGLCVLHVDLHGARLGELRAELGGVAGRAAGGIVMRTPAAPGTGVIAGGAARPVLECAGVQDILSKSLGSDNALNVVRATVDGLKQLVRPEEVAARRGKSIEEVTPARMLRKRAGQEA